MNENIPCKALIDSYRRAAGLELVVYNIQLCWNYGSMTQVH